MKYWKYQCPQCNEYAYPVKDADGHYDTPECCGEYMRCRGGRTEPYPETLPEKPSAPLAIVKGGTGGGRGMK